MKSKLDMEINDLVESLDVAKFESGVDHKSLKEEVDSRITSTKETLTKRYQSISNLLSSLFLNLKFLRSSITMKRFKRSIDLY